MEHLGAAMEHLGAAMEHLGALMEQLWSTCYGALVFALNLLCRTAVDVMLLLL
jgi:hypothetical protein